MTFQRRNGQTKKISRTSVLAMALVLAALIATLGWAGILYSSNGDSIKQELVAPGGGGQASDLSANTITSSVGQATGTISETSSGLQLYHGAHSPLSLSDPPPPPTAVKNWERYE